jgi:subtilisin family serine protease
LSSQAESAADKRIGRFGNRCARTRVVCVLKSVPFGLSFFVIAAVPLTVSAALGFGTARARPIPSPQHPVGDARTPASPRARAHFRHGVVLAGFRRGVPAGQRYAIERAAGAEGARRLGPVLGGTGRRGAGATTLPAPLLLRVRAGQVLVVVRRLRRSRMVAYAEPDYLEQGSSTPNDPSFSLEWGDENTGQAIPSQDNEEQLGPLENGTPGADDHALQAWQVTTGSRSIVIGETDTGVEYTHPDLAANIWSNPGGIGGCAAGTHGYNVLDRSCSPTDEDNAYGGHGTHVAGILGAVGNNGIGVVGMNWQTTILPIKWMQTASSGTTSALIEGLQWLVAAKQAGVNVRVVNDSDTFYGTAYSQALSNEIDVLGANGILFVAAAGNTGNDNDEVAVQRYPCSYDRPTEICVTASDNNDQLPRWANYGPHTVDLAAPGVSIYSTLRGHSYGYLSGGSMAAPQVAGAAALILSVAPSLSVTELRADILENVDQRPSLQGRVITGGRLDVYKALAALPGLSTPPSTSQSAPPTVSTETRAAAQSPTGEEPTPSTAVISGLTILPSAFAASYDGPTISHGVISGGASVSYDDSEAALTSFAVLAPRSGVEGPGHRCVTAARGKRKAKAKRCTFYAKVGSFFNHDRVGHNRFRFSGRMGGRKLAPGPYRLEALPTFAGRTGARSVAMFRITR